MGTHFEKDFLSGRHGCKGGGEDGVVGGRVDGRARSGRDRKGPTDHGPPASPSVVHALTFYTHPTMIYSTYSHSRFSVVAM